MPGTRTNVDTALRVLLFVGGLALIGLAVGLIFWGAGAGPTRVVTVGSAPHATVTTYPGRPATSNVTLDDFLLGVGVVLLLVSAFYDRISSIKLPGGGEIDLTPAASAQLASHVKDAVSAQQAGHAAAGAGAPPAEQAKAAAPAADPHQFEQLYRKALSTLSADYWGKVASPPDDALLKAANDAVASLKAAT